MNRFFLDNESFLCHNKGKEKQKSGFSATLQRKENETKVEKMIENLIFNFVIAAGFITAVILLTWLAVLVLCVIAHYFPATRATIKKILNPDNLY